MVDSSAAAPAGIAVHLLLSLLLAGVFTVAVWLPFARKLRFVPAMLVAVAALSGVWAINFFVILPVLNPAFVVLLPYAATLFSKVLFGIAMASGLAYAGGSRSVAPAKQRSEASHSSANVALARAYVRRSEEQGSRRRRDVTAKANRSSRVCCGSVFRYGVASTRELAEPAPPCAAALCWPIPCGGPRPTLRRCLHNKNAILSQLVTHFLVY